MHNLKNMVLVQSIPHEIPTQPNYVPVQGFREGVRCYDAINITYTYFKDLLGVCNAR